ncbi:MAG: riboflavin synthase subunit alpha [Actinomycetia bacterium]|jgi:riboflavin synthase|nr:riboflavin synthase subunit alpha [Actinomycetes bacterium]
MFTGIVEELGTVVARDGERLVVRGPVTAADAATGDSIAIDGVCLTVVERREEHLFFDLSEETLSRTNLGSLGPEDAVNLERPATLASRLGGHLVQGHVDGVAEVTAVRPEGEDGVRLSVRLPGELLRHVAEKGSITFDGVSLTVAALDGDVVEIALIPHTLHATTLGSVRERDRVNVEVDIVAKYVARNLEYLTTDGATVVRPRKERTA